MPTSATRDTRLVWKSICEGTGTFRFERPEPYPYHSGQFAMLGLATREGDAEKPFSICTAPADPYLEFCTRMTGSAFKDALGALEPGDPAWLSDAKGRLAMPAEPLVVFLGGGVGITPLRSMARDAEGRRGRRLLLLYGSNTEDCIPYREELDELSASDPEFEVVHVIAQPSEGWMGERGFITPEVVRRHVDPAAVGHWVTTGPPAMMTAMKSVLAGLSVPEDKATFEVFAGY